jgi:hypoxanthine phosphoribosyltransferase
VGAGFRLTPGRGRADSGIFPPCRAAGTPCINLSPPNGAFIVHDDINRVLIPEEEIQSGIDRLASEITGTYRGSDFTVVSVLKGSCIFAADLIRRIPIPLELAFVAARSYGDRTTSGELAIDLLPAGNEIEGRRMLLVDDILDTGQTLHRLKAELLERGAAEVRTCVFLDKPSRRALEFEADLRAFEVEDLFVVGYGLDYAGRYRNLPYVGVLKPELFQ